METSIACCTVFFENMLWPRWILCLFLFPFSAEYTSLCLSCLSPLVPCSHHFIFKWIQSQQTLWDLSCHFRSQKLTSWWPCECYYYKLGCLMRKMIPVTWRHMVGNQYRASWKWRAQGQTKMTRLQTFNLKRGTEVWAKSLKGHSLNFVSKILGTESI